MMTAALLCALLPAVFGDVLTVGPGPQYDFGDLQLAIDSAPPGADLRLASGAYVNDYFIDGKSLTLTGGSVASVEGSLVVSNIAADQTVILRGLEVEGQVDAGLTIRDSSGLVLAEDCVFRGISQPGVQTFFAGAVVLNEVQTRSVGYSTAGRGLIVSNTDFLYAHGSSCTGGTGNDGAVVSGSNGSVAYFGGSVCRGGSGFNTSAAWACGGNGGDGLVKLSTGHEVRMRATVVLRGAGGSGTGSFGICGSCTCNGYPGVPVVGSVESLGGPEPELIVPTEVAPGQGLVMTVSRELGDEVYVSFTDRATPQDVVGDRGVLFSNYTGPPPGNPDWLLIGSLTSSSLTATVQVPPSAVSSDGLTYVQTSYFDPVADRWLYGPLRVVAVRPPNYLVASVCNGDGGDQLGCTNCPFGLNAAPGTIGGCKNSADRAARLLVSGSHSVSLPSGSANDLRFSMQDGPPESFCRLVSGSAAAPGNPSNPCFGLASGVQSTQFRGLRCAINDVRRHGGRPADIDGYVGVTTNPWGGESGPPLGIAQASGFVSGQTRYFQAIYRDQIGGCCDVLNTTQAIRLTFVP